VVNDWARTERLNPERLVALLLEQHGVRLTVEGLCPGGQVGAAYVRWQDGRRSVLTWRPGVDLHDVMAGPLAVVEALRASGYPAPATELAVQVGSAVVLVQQLLEGQKMDGFDLAALGQALRLNELQAGQLAERANVPEVRLYLRDDGPGFCLHEPLRRFSARSAALERWVSTVGDGCPDVLSTVDAVHFDFHPGNLLAADGVITGIVDWDGAGRGDRRLDLVTLRFGLHAKTATQAVVDLLDVILESVPEEVLQVCWAHMSLRMVDWAIRHFSAADVDHWLDLAERRVN
jgi:hypothetical protein